MRILLLRTFKDDPLNFIVLNSLACAVRRTARVEIVGDQRDRRNIETAWHKAFGDDTAVGEVVDMVSSTSETWQREVIRRIDEVDVIVLHISPKDVDFPDFPFPPPVDGPQQDFWEQFMDSPHVRPLTGRGLLREICYLNRLQRLPDTVVVCHARYQPMLDDLIALGGAMGNATDIYGNLITPRLTAIDKQVGHLRKAYQGITYRWPGGDSPVLPRLADSLGTAVAEIVDRGRTGERSSADLKNLTGTSPSPRPLPPDGELKIVSLTPVEDVLFLPSGPLVEVHHEELAEILNREAVRTGCPSCRAPLTEMFFFVRGLERRGRLGDGGKTDWPNAVCQRCGHKSSLFGNDMLAPQ